MPSQSLSTPAAAPPAPAPPPVDFNSLVDLAISKPARYLGNELGVINRDWARSGLGAAQ